MLQKIRNNSQGWISKTIIGVIILLLALTGFEAIFRATDHKNVAIEVNGDEISLMDVDQAIQIQLNQMRMRLGNDFDPSLLDETVIKETAIDSLIDRTLLTQALKHYRFAFSDQALDQLILQMPEFQANGRFNAELFDQFARQRGYSRLQLRQVLSEEVLLSQLRMGVSATGFVTESELQAFARLEKQTRDFAITLIKANPDQVTISDDDVQAYYDTNQTKFMSPEQIVIDYVELNKSAFFDQVAVSDDDLQALYQQEIANLSEQRDAAHILIEANDDASEEEALAKLKDIQARLATGEDFADLAKEFSQDTGSAVNGGDLGYAGRGVYDPAFEEALFELAETGDVSEPVRTAFGYHLIKLLGVQEPDIPTLDTMKPQLEETLKRQMVDQRFIEAVRELEGIAYESSDLSQPAQEMGLQVKTSPAFGRNGGEGIAANRQVIQAAFSAEVLEDAANSGAIELDPDTVVVLRVKEHRKPQQQTLEQVADAIRQQLIKERTAANAQQEGETLIAQLEQNPETDGREWKTFEASGRAQEGVDGQVLEEVFRMPHPSDTTDPVYSGISLANGDYAVIRLKGVSVPMQSLTDNDKALYRRFLTSRHSQEDFSAFRRQLKNEATIKRY